MSIVAFYTLKLARKLEEAGFSARQAGDTAEALAGALGEEVATKREVERVETSLKSSLRELELRMTIKLGGLIIAATGVIMAGIRYLPAGHP